MPHSTLAFLPFLSLPRTIAPSRFRHTLTPCATLALPTSLPNLRDLATAAPHLLRPGLIYRGSTPAALPPDPSPETIAFLRAAPVLLDLRSRDERSSDKLAEIVSVCGDDFHDREVHISLLNKRRIVYGLARALPPQQTKDLAIHALFNPTRARKAIVGRMDQGGLLLLNRILVDVGAKRIGRAMHVIADGVSVDSSGPVYFYCSAGKDRTGLLAALILSVMGVPRHDIIRDYVRSSETWENGPYELRQDYCARLEHAGLTPLNWLGAPPEVMDETLRFIDHRYGSVEDYLIAACDFDEHHMQQLRTAMSVK